MNQGNEKITYKYGMAPAYWKYSWGSLPYGVTTLPRSDDLRHMPERWVVLERKIWQVFVDGILNLNQKKILDLGCGAGKLIQFLLENNATSNNITALDENEQLIKWCSQIWKDVVFINDNAIQQEKLQKKLKFDLVVSHMLFNLLDDTQLTSTLYNIYEKMNYFGILAFQIPSSVGKKGKYLRLTDQSQMIIEQTPWGPTPYYFRSEERIKSILQATGFKLLSITNYAYQAFDENTVHLTNTIGVDRSDPKRMFIVCEKK